MELIFWGPDRRPFWRFWYMIRLLVSATILAIVVPFLLVALPAPVEPTRVVVTDTVFVLP